MSVVGNTNASPKPGPDEDDLIAMIGDAVGKGMADMVKELRATQSAAPPVPVETNKTPTKSSRRSRRDKLATMDVDDMNGKDLARMFARSLKVLHQAGNDVDLAIEIAKSQGQETLVKSMQAGSLADGGFAIPHEFSDGIIEELTAQSTVLAHGPMELTLPEGGISIPYVGSGATSSYAGEATAVNGSKVSGGQLRLDPKKLISVVGVSNDLLRGNIGGSDDMIVNSIVKGMVATVDITLIRGVGGENEPQGMASLAAAANKIAVNTTVNLANITLDLLKLFTALEEANINPANENVGWVMAPSIANYLKGLRVSAGADGAWAFPEMQTGMLLGYPYKITSQIPKTLDFTGSASNNESEIYLTAYNLMVFARNESLIVERFPGGSYLDSTGATVSGVSADTTPIRVIQKHDFAAQQRGQEITMLEGVDWGA